VTAAARLGARFRIFQAAVLGSDLADGIYKLSLPILAITISDSVLAVAAVGVAIRAPWIVVTLPAGVLVDRHDPLRVMKVASWVRLPAVAAVCLAAFADVLPLWGLVGAAFLIGGCGTVVDLAAQSLVPRLVAAERIPSANANLQTGQTVMGQFAGPALAGFLAVIVGGGIGGAALCYLLTLAALALLGRGTSAPREPRHKSPLWTELREGAAHFARRRDLVGLAGVGAASNLGFSATVTILPIWVVSADHLNQSERVLGFVIAAPAVGALVAGPFTARVLTRFGGRAVLRVVAPLAGLCFLAVAVPDPVVGFAAMAGYGAIAVVLNVMSVSHRQSTIAPELFGRVNAVFRWIILGVSPVGAALGGVIAVTLGTAATFVGAGLLTVATGLVLPSVLVTATEPATT
jgi:MFS family permease